MTLIQILIAIAIAIVAAKLVASALGRDLPILNLAVSAILLAFVSFEIWNLGRALLTRWG